MSFALNQPDWRRVDDELFQAIRLKNVQKAKQCLDWGANVNAPPNTRFDYLTPLILSIYCNKLELTRFLLQNGADPNRKTNWDTPLISAVRVGNVEIVRLLLEHRADVNQWLSETDRLTPLHYAILNQNLSCFQALIQHGANIHSVSESQGCGSTPISIALGWLRWDFVDAMLASADINDFKGGKGSPILIHVLQDYCPCCVELASGLLERGADPNISWTNHDGSTALIAAIQAYHCRSGGKVQRKITLSVLQMLLRYNADVDKADHCGNTPLIRAIGYYQRDIANFLIVEGRADPVRPTNSLGHTAFTEAVSSGLVDITYLIFRDNLDYFIPGIIKATRK